MTDRIPAEDLRTAATLLRNNATAATPGPWTSKLLPANDTHKHPAYWVNADYTDEENVQTLTTVADCPWRMADASHIATMHPGVALALADWLDTAAADAMPCRCKSCPTQAALAVARQILGTQATEVTA